MMAVTVPCRHGVKDTRYAGVFFYGQALCTPGSHHTNPVQCRWPLPPDVGLTEGIPEGRGNSFSALRRGQEHGSSVRICQTSPPVRHPLSCPGRAVKRCLRSLTVLVSSKNTLFQQQTGAHEISTITDHDFFARARRKAQYDRAAALFHYPGAS